MKAFALVAFVAMVATAVVAVPDGYHQHHGGYHHEEKVHVGPAKVYTIPVKAPAVKCGHNLLISCNPLHAVVPCKAEKAHHGGYHHHGHDQGHDHGHKYHHAPAHHGY